MDLALAETAPLIVKQDDNQNINLKNQKEKETLKKQIPATTFPSINANDSSVWTTCLVGFYSGIFLVLMLVFIISVSEYWL